MRPVELLGLHVEGSTGSPIVLLREHAEPHRVVPIFIGSAEATAIALVVNGEEPPRPLTHDLLAEVVRSLRGQLDAVEVTELRDSTFHARLRLTAPTGTFELDSRPSDAIALGLRLGAPLFVSDEVLDEAGTTVTEPEDEEAIEGAVEEFRSFLDEVEPDDFAPGGGVTGGEVTGGSDTDERGPPTGAEPNDEDEGR